MIMKTYLEKLNLAQEEDNVSREEVNILKYIWYFSKLELLPYKYLPLHYNVFLLFSVVFISITAAMIFVLIMYSIMESSDIAIEIYNNTKYKYFNSIAWCTSIWLILLVLFKKKINWCNYSEKYWKKNHTTCITKYTNTTLIVFFMIIAIINIFLFENKYIIFMVTLVSLVIIHETIIELLHFHSIKNWIKIPVINIVYTIKEEKEISNIGLGNIGMTKLYSLDVKYSYRIKGKIYFSSQVYMDEPRDGQLFKNKNKYTIEQWILENKNHIKDISVNKHRPNEAIIFKEILLSSYVGKFFIVIGSLFMIYVINNHINLDYYFQ